MYVQILLYYGIQNLAAESPWNSYLYLYHTFVFLSHPTLYLGYPISELLQAWIWWYMLESSIQFSIQGSLTCSELLYTYEMKDKINFPNLTIRDWYPSALAEKRVLWNYQILALAWMETRIDYDGGILADGIELGKVISLHIEHAHTMVIRII